MSNVQCPMSNVQCPMSNVPSSLWLGRLANLNAARTAERGIAPHKPLMLLTVIDLIESGDIPDGWVKFDVRLVSRFRDYWELVLERQRNQPDIPMPFHALGGVKDRIWECFTADRGLWIVEQRSEIGDRRSEDGGHQCQPQRGEIRQPRAAPWVPNQKMNPALAPRKAPPKLSSLATCVFKSSVFFSSTTTQSPETTIPATASPSPLTLTGCSTPGCGRSFQRAITC